MYRKYRSLGTPPKLTFQARLLNNQKRADGEKGSFRKISSRAFFRGIGRCSHPLGCGAIEPGKSVQGVCQYSDTYGIPRSSRRGLDNQDDFRKETNVPGFPTWDVGGKLYPGEQSLEELEEIIVLDPCEG